MRSPGFTLLEVLGVLALSSVLMGLAALGLVELARTARLAGAVRTTASTLRLARARALAGGASIEVRFDTAAPATIETRPTGGGPIEIRALPPGIVVAGTPARGRVLFGALGTAENGTVTLTAGPRARRVIVNQRGRVRVG